jgi:hypothetical protein
MTTAVLASSFLSGSLLTMLVPMATVIVILTWGVLAIARHERHRESVQTGGRPTAGADGPDGAGTAGSPSAGAG